MRHKVEKLRSFEGLMATALILTLLIAGCASAQLANVAGTSPTAPPGFLPPDMKGSIRTIGVVTGGDPQIALHAYEKDFGADIATTTVVGGLGGFALGFLGTFFFEFALRSTVVAFGGPNGDYGPIVSLFLPPILLTTALGGGRGFVLAAANSVPAKRGEEIEAAVLPALTDSSFQDSMVQQVLAAGTRDTQYSLRDLRRADAGDHISGQADAIFNMSVQNVGLRYWAVRARFVRNGHAGVTQWTTCPGFLPLITKEGSIMGEGSLFSQLSGMFKFSTPALPAE